MKHFIFCLFLALIAFGTIWTAYESHIANIGVMAWQRQFEEIRNDAQSTPLPLPTATATPIHGSV